MLNEQFNILKIHLLVFWGWDKKTDINAALKSGGAWNNKIYLKFSSQSVTV